MMVTYWANLGNGMKVRTSSGGASPAITEATAVELTGDDERDGGAASTAAPSIWQRSIDEKEIRDASSIIYFLDSLELVVFWWRTSLRRRQEM